MGTYVCDSANRTGFFFLFHGQVVELVDTQVSKTCAERRVGSSPTLATKIKLEKN